MANRLYVGNLAFDVGEATLESFFEGLGVKVEKVQVMRDTASGRSRGFAFVQLDPGTDLEPAIVASHGKELNGRPLTVNEAQGQAPGQGRRPFGGRSNGRRGGGRPSDRRGGGGRY